MVKIIKYFLLFFLLIIIVLVSYLIFESLAVKRGVNYQNLDEIPKVSWLNIRSGIFGLVMKTTTKRTLEYYDETIYISVIAPSEERFKEQTEASLYYQISGVIPNQDTDIKLFKYPAVFRTKFRGSDYILFLQENIQKNEKTGYILIAYLRTAMTFVTEKLQQGWLHF